MLIFWDQRLVFLATPKAGSSAIEMALESLASVSLQRPAEAKHTDIATYRRHFGPWLHALTGHGFTTVALMREPVDWLRSWYRFKLRDDLDDPQHAMHGTAFGDFASTYAGLDGPARLRIGTQSDFLTNGDARVDRIFRYEDIDSFVEFLESRLNCAIELPRINVPPSVDVHLDPEVEKRLRTAMARDLGLYDSLASAELDHVLID
ncbi:hypothetical protein [Paracoccus rhizosphaerae]|uniref:Sulfotransferase family protein n=1 Tax=Paracoccus rhizosphaerae TaxID=1133347 RepID=A0ABV6CEE5_9RHOB|nr:hypothetical protein [Paracoccus rhizosphaerae]